MTSHELRKDDPVFYKKALRGLISEARENGIKVDVTAVGKNRLEKAYINFRNGTDECASVEIIPD